VSRGQRLRRPDPERTEPLRDWAKLYRAPDSWNPREAPGEAPRAEAAPESWRDVVAEGVAVGYRVIEDQIRQGQRVAEQLNEASYGAEAMTGDVREATERMIRYSADLFALWLDFVNSTVTNGDFLRTLAAAWQPRAGGHPTSAGPGAPAAMAVDIRSARPVRVCVELKPSAAGRPLALDALRAMRRDTPPLTDVKFEPNGDAGQVALRLCVPDGYPAGVYTGVVVDEESGEALGTVSARLAE
jgi:hypothetical protein